MELQYAFLYEQNTKAALDKIFQSPMHGDLLVNVNKLHRACEKNFVILQKEFKSLVKKHSELDEKGEVKEFAGPGTFKVKEEAMTDWNKEVSELMAKTFEVKGLTKIPIQKLLSSGVSLSSSDLQNLEPVLSGLEALE